MNKHRSWTPGLREANLLIYFVNLADNRGPDRRRPGPHPERISSCYIKALRPSDLGSRRCLFTLIRLSTSSSLGGNIPARMSPGDLPQIPPAAGLPCEARRSASP